MNCFDKQILICNEIIIVIKHLNFFKEMISAAGFKRVSYENLTFGTVAIHIGYKV